MQQNHFCLGLAGETLMLQIHCIHLTMGTLTVQKGHVGPMWNWMTHRQMWRRGKPAMATWDQAMWVT
jgi:hypothetical protein